MAEQNSPFGPGTENNPVPEQYVRRLPDISTHHVPPSDDIAGIQSVIDDHGPGVRIKLGAGTYAGSELSLDDATIIEGVSYSNLNGTVLQLSDGSDADLITTKADGTSSQYRCELHDLVLDGNKANNTSGNCLYGYFWSSLVKRCKVMDAPEKGLWFAHSSGDTNDDNSVVDSIIDNCNDYGLLAGTTKSSSSGGNSVFKLQHTNLSNNAGNEQARLYGNSQRISDVKTYYETGSNVAMALLDCVGARVSDCDFAGMSTSDRGLSVVARNSAVRNLRIVNSTIRESMDDGIGLFADGQDMIGVRIDGNVIDPEQDGESANGSAVNAFGTGSYTSCVVDNNTFLGSFPSGDTTLPAGWGATNNTS